MMESKRLVIGILAPVDAGKTTLAESVLYLSGAIRKTGRVDHKDTFLDTHELERQRGITIFAKQANMMLDDLSVTLLDTPGHVDFSAEMERTLPVLDYAILVINGMDGVQGHVITLWKLLEKYQIPVFLFINKMDQSGTDKAQLLEQLKHSLSEGCLPFTKEHDEAFLESLAMCDELFMEKYLETGDATEADITRLIKQRKVFPCYFGSALKAEGVVELLEAIKRYGEPQDYPSEFGAKVYKISRDAQGNRLTHLKITGGCLKVKMTVAEEKVNQIRIYSGVQYQAVNEVGAGEVCTVTGLNNTYAGAGLGITEGLEKPMLEPVLTYRLNLPPESDVHQMYSNLCELEEEDPQLHVVWEQQSSEILIQVMGAVQIEILESLILERYQVEVSFSAGSIVYKETISQPVNGVGHFEPLRHYAEVHLLLEPGERGSGLVYASDCSEDILDGNWQRLVLNHLQEKVHRGTLIGAEITDMKITLTSGRAHLKHTEGGDFREATYRAVRQGLKKATGKILEPFYDFRIEVPADKAGRVMSDIGRMSGTFTPPIIADGRAVVVGVAPVATMQNYQSELATYARGEGRLTCTLKGYQECHNADEVIAAVDYDSEKDVENPTGSVFCSHGSGFFVPWNEVPNYMHIKEQVEQERTVEPEITNQGNGGSSATASGSDKELEEIFVRTYGQIDRKRIFPAADQVKTKNLNNPYVQQKKERVEEYLLVDGYNIIFAWQELNELSKVSLAGARDRLSDILSNYQGYKKNTIILVFDAYKVEDSQGEIQKYKNIHIVYTKKAETADQYIERTTKKMVEHYHVTVATSDALEQMIIWGMGAMRLSANGLKEEIDLVNIEIKEQYLEQEKKLGSSLLGDFTVE